MMANYLLFTIRYEATAAAVLARVYALRPSGELNYWIATHEYPADTDRAAIVADVIREMGNERVAVYQPMMSD